MSDPIIDHVLLNSNFISVENLIKFVGITSLLDDITNGVSFIAGSFPCFLNGFARKFNDIDIFYVLRRGDFLDVNGNFCSFIAYRYLYRKGLIDRDCGNRHMLINSLEHYGPMNEDYRCFKDEEIGVFDSYREDFCIGGCLN